MDSPPSSPRSPLPSPCTCHKDKKMMPIDQILSAIHIDGLTKKESERIVAMAYQMCVLDITIGDIHFDHNHIPFINPSFLNKKTSNAYFGVHDGEVYITSNDKRFFSNRISHMESEHAFVQKHCEGAHEYGVRLYFKL